MEMPAFDPSRIKSDGVRYPDGAPNNFDALVQTMAEDARVDLTTKQAHKMSDDMHEEVIDALLSFGKELNPSHYRPAFEAAMKRAEYKLHREAIQRIIDSRPETKAKANTYAHADGKRKLSRKVAVGLSAAGILVSGISIVNNSHDGRPQIPSYASAKTSQLPTLHHHSAPTTEALAPKTPIEVSIHRNVTSLGKQILASGIINTDKLAQEKDPYRNNSTDYSEGESSGISHEVPSNAKDPAASSSFQDSGVKGVAIVNGYVPARGKTTGYNELLYTGETKDGKPNFRDIEGAEVITTEDGGYTTESDIFIGEGPAVLPGCGGASKPDGTCITVETPTEAYYPFTNTPASNSTESNRLTGSWITHTANTFRSLLRAAKNRTPVGKKEPRKNAAGGVSGHEAEASPAGAAS